MIQEITLQSGKSAGPSNRGSPTLAFAEERSRRHDLLAAAALESGVEPAAEHARWWLHVGAAGPACLVVFAAALVLVQVVEESSVR